MENQSTSKRNQILMELVSSILKKCKEEEIEVRVMGGLAIFLKYPGYEELSNKIREPFSDIDLITRQRDIEKIETLFGELGFEQNRNFKILFGYQRRIFYTPMDITVEVYLDDLHLCQELKISERLSLDYPTICATDLLLSKIQRVDLQDKDVFDILVLLANCGFSRKSCDNIDLEYISELCSKNWGWWKIFKINLKRLLDYNRELFGNQGEGNIDINLKQIGHAIDSKKKSIGWKLRNIIGEKIKWYSYVEE